MVCKDFDDNHCDRCCALIQMYNFGPETHLGVAVMSAFAFPSGNIA